jgi:hypothetical protein
MNPGSWAFDCPTPGAASRLAPIKAPRKITVNMGTNSRTMMVAVPRLRMFWEAKRP